MARLPPRLLGIGLIASAGAVALWHRRVYEAARHGPAQVAELGLSLMCFALASTGILLLIHGAGLFGRRWRRDDGDPGAAAESRTRPQVPARPSGRAFDTRDGAAMVQARHRIARLRGTQREGNLP
jgi:hypothetical protein